MADELSNGLSGDDRLRALENQVRDLKQRLSKEHDQSLQSVRYHTQFLSHISRDIRTPLSGITSIVELLLRSKMPQAQRDYIEIIKESAESVLAVLEEVVEFNRHEAEQFWPSFDEQETPPSRSAKKQAINVLASEQLKKARVLVVTGLLGSAEFIEAYATASGIKCEGISRGQSALTMMKQATLIGQPYDVIFVERLLPDMDAFEFARRIKQERELAESKLILVSTFDSAARDDHALKAGFSEHIAKPMKQQHVLSTLTAVLQGRPQPVVIEAPQQLVKDQIAPAVARGTRMILVAEDNPVNQKVALLQLRELGFFATVVANGRESIAVLKQAEFDAVLMDVQMPEMDGYEATKAIREWERETGKHVPIIAMTASAGASEREKCIEAGMDDYLSKPVTYDKLDAVLFKWVESHEEQNSPAGEKTMQEPIRETHSFGVPQAEVVDLNGLTELLGPEEAIEVLKLFVDSTEDLISQIVEASARHDAKALKEAAHQLKGAASSVGANTIARACMDLEQCAKNDDWSATTKLNDGLTANFQNAKTYIQSLNS